MYRLLFAIPLLFILGCSTSKTPDRMLQALTLSYAQEWDKLVAAGEVPAYVVLKTSSGPGSAKWEKERCEIQLPRELKDAKMFESLASSTSPSITAHFVIQHEIGHCLQFKNENKEVLLPQEKEAHADLHALSQIKARYSMAEYMKFYSKLVQFREQAQIYGGRGQVYRRSNAHDTARYLRSAAL